MTDTVRPAPLARPGAIPERRGPRGSWPGLYAGLHKFLGSWAFLGHRASGLALMGYVFWHIYSLRGLQEALPAGTPIQDHPWTLYIRHYGSGVWLFLEWTLFSVVLVHALNGFRIVIVDLLNGSRYHRALLWGFGAIGAVLFFGMGWVMLRHALFGT